MKQFTRQIRKSFKQFLDSFNIDYTAKSVTDTVFEVIVHEWELSCFTTINGMYLNLVTNDDYKVVLIQIKGDYSMSDSVNSVSIVKKSVEDALTVIFHEKYLQGLVEPKNLRLEGTFDPLEVFWK